MQNNFASLGLVTETADQLFLVLFSAQLTENGKVDMMIICPS